MSSWSMFLPSGLKGDPEFGTTPFPEEIIGEVIHILDAQNRAAYAARKQPQSESPEKKQWLGTLASLSVVNRGVRLRALKALWKYSGEPGVRHLTVVSADTRAVTRFIILASLEDLAPFQRLHTWTWEFVDPSPTSSGDTCKICIGSNLSSTASPGTAVPAEIGDPKIKLLKVINLPFKRITRLLETPFTFKFISVVRIKYIRGDLRSHNISSALDWISRVCPNVKLLHCMNVVEDEAFDQLELLRERTHPPSNMSHSKTIIIDTTLVVPRSRRVLQDRGGRITISGPRNYLLNSRKARSGGIVDVISPHKPGQDKPRDALKGLLETLVSVEEDNEKCPSLQHILYRNKFKWNTVEEEHVLYIIGYHRLNILPERNAFGFHREDPSEPTNPEKVPSEPIHPDGNLACSSPRPDGLCLLAEELTHGKRPRKFRCPVCYRDWKDRARKAQGGKKVIHVTDYEYTDLEAESD